MRSQVLLPSFGLRPALLRFSATETPGSIITMAYGADPRKNQTNILPLKYPTDVVLNQTVTMWNTVRFSPCVQHPSITRCRLHSVYRQISPSTVGCACAVCFLQGVLHWSGILFSATGGQKRLLVRAAVNLLLTVAMSSTGEEAGVAGAGA